MIVERDSQIKHKTPSTNGGVILSGLDFAFDAAVNFRFDGAPPQADRSLKDAVKYGAFPYLWRKMAGVSLRNYKGREAFTSFAHIFELVGRYDDILDCSGCDLAPTDFKNDSIAKPLLGEVIERVRQSPAGKDLKQGFLKDFANFRRTAYRAFLEHELNPNSDRTFAGIRDYKELICGTNARLAARFCRLFSPGTSDDVATKVEDAFVGVCLYFQIGDDLTDMRTDDVTKSPNFYWAALEQHQSEEVAVRGLLANSSPINISALGSVAPASVELCHKAVQDYRAEVGEDFSNFLPLVDLIYGKLMSEVKPLETQKLSQ